jgi:oligopeptide/dipeptide ABC transporter ATP-binding protein
MFSIRVCGKGESVSSLLSVEDLKVVFDTSQGEARAVDGISFEVRKGETVGIVGESGCGKSVTALSLMRLVPTPPGRVTGGRIMFERRDILEMSTDEVREIRGNEIAMIFQEPMTSLNPVFTIGNQIAEALSLHRGLNRSAAADEAVRMLESVEMPDAAARADDYPHQLSGGMRQRVMIAMALSCGPSLLIADEPTTALDVTIQAQILELLGSLKENLGMAVLLITHDLGVVAEYATRILVMYAGRIVEQGPVDAVLERPMHPYTRGLLASQPGFAASFGKLATIPGIVPKLTALPRGCRFRDRCDLAEASCETDDPSPIAVGDGHLAACPIAARGVGA